LCADFRVGEGAEVAKDGGFGWNGGFHFWGW
jgi:hypothetical protein